MTTFNIIPERQYEIKGRGTVFIVKQSRHSSILFAKLFGKVVRIDGQKYEVTGIESTHKNGGVADELGLVVTKVQSEPEEQPKKSYPEYLRGLAERLRHIPTIHGTDEYDCDQLLTLAKIIEQHKFLDLIPKEQLPGPDDWQVIRDIFSNHK